MYKIHCCPSVLQEGYTEYSPLALLCVMVCRSHWRKVIRMSVQGTPVKMIFAVLVCLLDFRPSE